MRECFTDLFHLLGLDTKSYHVIYTVHIPAQWRLTARPVDWRGRNIKIVRWDRFHLLTNILMSDLTVIWWDRAYFRITVLCGEDINQMRACVFLSNKYSKWGKNPRDVVDHWLGPLRPLMRGTWREMNGKGNIWKLSVFHNDSIEQFRSTTFSSSDHSPNCSSTIDRR